MPGRTYSAGTGYRYGFNGQEKTDEIAGVGNHTTAEFWEYDPRTGRRWNVDPVPKPYFSGYSAFANNPINFIDPNGADTLKIKGANNSLWTIHWGKGTNSSTYDLNNLNKGWSDYLIPDKVFNKYFDIGKQTINLDETFPDRTPDVIGLDIYAGGNVSFAAGGGGLNFLYHTSAEARKMAGENGVEVHSYSDAGVQTSTGVGVGVGASFIVGWAAKNVGGQSQRASNEFITNGVNWTGNFNVVNGSFNVAKLWGKADLSVNVSRFSGMTLGATPTPMTEYWHGYSFGLGLGVGKNPTKATGLGDIIKSLNGSTFGVHQQYYYMLYGNGGDKLNNGKNVSGWNLSNPIDPKDNQ